MSSLTVYHLKNCDSCRKALKALSAAGHAVKAIDVRVDGVSPDALAAIEKAVGWEALLNTRSTTWRGLDANEKEGVDAPRALSLIAKFPTLMKRPVIIGDGKTTLGWTKTAQDIWL